MAEGYVFGSHLFAVQHELGAQQRDLLVRFERNRLGVCRLVGRAREARDQDHDLGKQRRKTRDGAEIFEHRLYRLRICATFSMLRPPK
jgi:hypothetical protein